MQGVGADVPTPMQSTYALTTRRINLKVIAYDENAIFSIANTSTDAIELAKIEAAGSVANYDADAAESDLQGFNTATATDALVDQVERSGGDIAWGELPNGIHCTVEEAEAAHVT